MNYAVLNTLDSLKTCTQTSEPSEDTSPSLAHHSEIILLQVALQQRMGSFQDRV